MRAPANNPKASRTPPGGFFVPDAKTFVPQAFATLRPSPFASREGPFQTAPAAFSGPTRPNSPMSRIPGLRHAWLFYKHLEKKYFQKHIFAVSGHSPFWLFAVTSAFCAPAPPTANHHRHHTATKSPRSAQSRQRCWSEEGWTGRQLILFVSLILGSQVRHVWRTKLKDKFSSSLEILDEMRCIRCIEHPGHARKITPFVGAQLEICDAFGFVPPERVRQGLHIHQKTGEEAGTSKEEGGRSE